MPNQRELTYKVFSVKLTEDEKILEIKLGDTHMWNITRKYRISVRHIINTYIEGPFGGYDENNVGQEHLWRIVISVSRFVDGILTDRDVVFHMPDEKKADELHSTLVDILNC